MAHQPNFYNDAQRAMNAQHNSYQQQQLMGNLQALLGHSAQGLGVGNWALGSQANSSNYGAYLSSLQNATPLYQQKTATPEILDGEYIELEQKCLPALEWKLEDELAKMTPGK